MASAQVLPNSAASSRKLGHLEAGKKKLEEFRKRKAEGRTKKAGLTGQLQPIDGGGDEKYSLNEENEGDGTTTSTGTGLSAILNRAPSSLDKHAISTDENTQVSHLYEKSSYASFVNGFHDHWKERSVLDDNEQSKFEASSSAAGLLASVDSGHTKVNNEESSDGLSCYTAPSDESNNFSAQANNADASNTPSLLMTEGVSAERRLGIHSTSLNSFSDSKNSSLGLEISNPGTSNNERLVDTQVRQKTISESINQRLNLGSASWQSLESSLIDSSMPIKRSQEAPSSATVYGATSGRSRPSFLDTLGVSRVSSTSHVSHPSNSFSDTTAQSTDVLFPSHEKPFTNVNSMQPLLSLSPSVFINEKENSLVSSSDIPIMPERSREYAQAGHEILVPKKDEAFSLLEQHIEDLTQDKFSLQRALDTSRTLADSLAAENSSITESYNQQAKVVSELKSEIERLQEEVKDQLRAVESLKLEYANAQLECNAADERAKILASEVIGLEEKALRLRSNELKMEKQSENLSSEIASYKRKVSIFDKERQDYQSTINAMQEEKKLLQSKLRKIYSSSKSDDTMRVPSSLRDASTSTDDLGDGTERQTREAEIISHSTTNELENSTTFDNSETTTLSQRDGTDALFPDGSIGIPCDQLRMINNITSLLSELAQEKEELIQALTMETSSTSKLKDLNKELSQKLEAQTQRLELLIAQRMATENILTKPSITYSIPDIMEYTDEGDEVVERVLGWILRFFPSGSSKRRTSKLL